MITGNLEDSSVAGLLQFLATEKDKNYVLTITNASRDGRIHIFDGTLVFANYGLLTGEDALCEFLSWNTGEFSVRKLPPSELSEETNLSVSLKDNNGFVGQCSYLAERMIGLNTVIVTSKTFGTTKWQELVKVCSLEPQDYVILGWLGEGRTTRQAAREFDINIVSATQILYRLLATQSVETRPLDLEQPELRNDHRRAQTIQEKQAVPVCSDSITRETEPAASLKAASCEHNAQEVKRGNSARSSLSDTGQIKRSMVLRLRSGLTKPVLPAGAEQHKSADEITADKLPAVKPKFPTGSTKISLDSTKEKKCSSEGNVSSVKQHRSKPATDGAKTTPDQEKAPETEPDKKPVAVIRTSSLPLVTIDIERLFKETFSISDFGKLALSNPSLDGNLRQTLLAVEAGKPLSVMLTDERFSPQGHLSSLGYCLERGYVNSNDAVIPLTIQLLLRRLEIDQYLLQRRRITGDELRELYRMSSGQDIKPSQLLVRYGYLTGDDLNRITIEQERFAAPK